MMQRVGNKNSNNKDFLLWKQDNHPILLKNAALAHQKLDYTECNKKANIRSINIHEKKIWYLKQIKKNRDILQY